MTVGIYFFQNKRNDKVYVGQSTNKERRYEEHVRSMKNYNGNLYSKFYEAFSKEPDNFEYYIGIECEVEELNELEMYYIQLYDSHLNGYNMTKGGHNLTGEESHFAILTEKQVEQIKYDLKFTKKTQVEIAKEYGVTDSNINSINNGRIWSHTEDYTYPIRFTRNPSKYCPVCKTKVSYQATLCDKCSRGEWGKSIMGENNSSAKLNNKEVTEIKRILFEDSSISQEQLASTYNVSISTIYRINRGQSWVDIGETYIYPIRQQVVKYRCEVCGIPIDSRSKRCRDCNVELRSRENSNLSKLSEKEIGRASCRERV